MAVHYPVARWDGRDNAWTAHTQSGSPQTVRSSTNQVRWIDTSGATFYITGIQLEVGDYATEFEHKSFADELARCQRYYEVVKMSTGTAMFHSAGNTTVGFVSHWWFKTEKRIGTPTISKEGNADFKTDDGNSRTLTGMFTAPDHVMLYNAQSNGGPFRLFDNSKDLVLSATCEP